MNTNDIHPDFMKFKSLNAPLYPAVLPAINFFLRRVFNAAKVPADVVQTRHKIKGIQGNSIPISIFEPEKRTARLPCLVYCHGGAFAMFASLHHKALACHYALKTPCKVAFVDYRLLPKNVFPAGLEDCYTALQWVRKHAETLGIDKNRIAIAGDSAGGALAAGVCLMSRDRSTPMPCFQMLVYPVTDQRQNTASMKEFSDTPLWNSKLNTKMWNMYLKNVRLTERDYASPAEAASLADMPPTYIEVAQHDCLRDEGIDFEKRLRQSGVPTQFLQSKGTVHGFEIARKNPVVQECINNRIAALQRAFDNNADKTSVG